MMNREQAIAYGKHIGVRYHIYNSNGCLVGGTKTLEQAQAMKRRFEIEERKDNLECHIVPPVCVRSFHPEMRSAPGLLEFG